MRIQISSTRSTASSQPRLLRIRRTKRHPYASPVYGDFSKGFPPTLIQGGLKETLLSGFVRLYQRLDLAGVAVKLDLYEGMIHNFQDRIPDAPESVAARGKMRDFLLLHLGKGRAEPRT